MLSKYNIDVHKTLFIEPGCKPDYLCSKVGSFNMAVKEELLPSAASLADQTGQLEATL